LQSIVSSLAQPDGVLVTTMRSDEPRQTNRRKVDADEDKQ
jgi:hypothetical protein